MHRRTRGATTITVTIGYGRGASDLDLARWNQMSAGYPPVTLDVPAGAGSGFYDCAGDAGAGACDVHIHLRSGYHVEVSGNGRAARADHDALLPSLGLRALAAAPSR